MSFVTLRFTYYQTNVDREKLTAMLESYNPDDDKQIWITFKNEDGAWVLQQPTNLSIRIFDYPDVILSTINSKVSEELKLQKLIIKKTDRVEGFEQ